MDPDDLVTVFEAGEPGLVAMAHSILEGAGIPYSANNDGTQDLFGCGRLWAGFNPIVGPVRFQVRQLDAAQARSLLEALSPKDVSES